VLVDEVGEMLRASWPQVERVAARLVEDRQLDGQMVANLIAGEPLR
jgi:hypothetical protein